MIKDRRFTFFLMASSLSALAGCDGSDSGPATGFLSLGVSDGPIHDAEKVCVKFDSIEFKPAGGQAFTIDLDPPESINLLDYQGANAAPLLQREELPAGNYAWIRLGVDAVRGSSGGAGDTGGPECDGEASYLVMKEDGLPYNLYVPSGAETGLKLVSGLTVPVNGSIDATVEWDLMKSITAPPGLDPDVVMKPTIRLVNNVEVGTLSGLVANDLATVADCDPAVYVFEDGVTPNAIDDDGGDPQDALATAVVNEQDNGDGTSSFHYEIGFLIAANYEAAFTCDGTTFEPAEGKAADITARQATTVDFP